MGDITMLPPGRYARKKTDSLRAWKESLKGEQHELKRDIARIHSRKGDSSQASADLEEANLYLEVAEVELNLEVLNTESGVHALRQRWSQELKLANLKLNKFLREHEPLIDEGEIAALQNEINQLEGAIGQT